MIIIMVSSVSALSSKEERHRENTRYYYYYFLGKIGKKRLELITGLRSVGLLLLAFHGEIDGNLPQAA